MAGEMGRKGDRGFAGGDYCCTFLRYSASSHQLGHRPGTSLKTSPFPALFNSHSPAVFPSWVTTKNLTAKRNFFFPVHQNIWGQLTWVSFATVSSWTDWATCGPGLSCERSETRNLYKGPTRLIWQLVPFHHPVLAGGHEKGGGCYWARSICTGYWLGFNPCGTQLKAEGGWYVLPFSW